MDGSYELENAEAETVADLSKEVNSFFLADETPRQFASRKKKILGIFEGALSELDSEGFFGKGKQRDHIILWIQIMDADEKEEKLMWKIVKRLNSKKSYTPFFKDAFE